jgi:hypothetical protein
MHSFRHARRAALLLTLSAAATAAHADVIDAVNALRRTGCSDVGGGLPAPRRLAVLDTAARRLAEGAELGDALAAVGYRAAQAFSAHVAGAHDERTIAGVLARDFCARLLDARLTEAGGYQRGAEAWVVLAAGAAAPALADPRRVARRVLALVNAARSAPRTCGALTFAAAAPLGWSDALADAARVHAADMEHHGFFEHTGSDGSDPLTRVTRTGYRARLAGENLAFNQESADAVVRGWLASPHHCANIMDPHFRELGVAYVVSRQRAQPIYWDLTLGARRHL